ncbi:hypothetical protein SASPL_106981 [Salvia splendens]|uniref:Pectin acetylesterase n=1 Tax=Salvia splendens TaxID=180675 RepID=A0A8X9A407_SALSN|nr:hypothetical protein SASPL_106981 [Salvia splendens]
MATLLLPLTILSLVTAGIVAAHNVSISLLDSAVARGADGTPPAYAYSPGFGDGVDNWHVFLQGGGWCHNVDNCLDRTRDPKGSSAKLMTEQNGVVSFGGMLDANSTLNPDFYNWHVFKIFYCDGSSFMSDVEDVDPKHNLTYRGARIYDAMMDELLRIGMGNAKNTIAQAVGDWFFDRSEFQEMDMLNDLPRNCTGFDDQPTLEKKCRDHIHH